MSTATQGVPFGGSSGADDRGLQRKGRDLLFAFASTVRALQLYPLENQAVVNALAELEGIVRGMIETEREVAVRYVGDFFFINDLRLRIDLASYATFGSVGRTFHRHGIGQIEVFPGVTTQEWTAFLSLLLVEPDEEDRFGHFAERLAGTGVLHIAVAPDRESERDDPT
ncbi:MAG TPA: hypothetical protein VE913_16450, partial [Longimicrobium sp.]|nr:hypothetical protein [Longimicrobium sp.]